MPWNRPASEGFTWISVKEETLGSLVHLATQSGASVIFGRTRDGSAATLTLVAGHTKETKYCRSQQDVAMLMSDLADPDFTHWCQKAIREA